MARTKRKVKPLPTIWHCPDDLWDQIMAPILDALDPPAKTGRPRIDSRKAFDGIIYHLRTGCQWNALPAEFGDDSSVHRTYQRWTRKGVFAEMWAVLIGCCALVGDEPDWTWQAADGFLGKARSGGIKSVPTPRIAGKTAPNARCSSMARAIR